MHFGDVHILHSKGLIISHNWINLSGAVRRKVCGPKPGPKGMDPYGDEIQGWETLQGTESSVTLTVTRCDPVSPSREADMSDESLAPNRCFAVV